MGAAKRFDVVPNDADRRILVLAGPLYDPGPGTGFSLETKRGEAECGEAEGGAGALTAGLPGRGGAKVRRAGRKMSRQAKARKQKAISRGLAVVQKGGLKTKKSRERTEKLKVLKELW